MRKLLSFMIVLFFIVPQIGCSFTSNKGSPTDPDQPATKAPLYELYYENGTQFLRFTEEGLQVLATPPSESLSTTYPSVSEMRRIIKASLLPESILYMLYNRSNDGETVAITDLAKLYDIHLPADVNLDYVTWSGNSYSFSFSKGEMYGSLRCVTEDSYQKYYEQYFVQEPNVLKGDVDILSDQQISDRNAREIRFNKLDVQNNRIDRERKLLIYSISAGDDILHIYEDYTVGVYFDNTFIKDSDDVPKYINFCGTSNGAYFYGQIIDPAERPTVEWYSTLSLERVIDNQA